MLPAEEPAPISISRVLGVPWKEAQAQAAAIQPWIAAFVGLNLFAMVGGVAGLWFLKTRLDSLSGSASVMARQTTDLSQRVSDLSDKAQTIQMEGTELRQYVASSSAEQVIFLKILILKPDIDLALARTIARNAHKYGALYKRDPDLVLAIIAEESRFNPDVISPVGAVGLMQVMPQWEKVLGIQGSLKDPETSIKYGLQVLGFYMEMYKDIEIALTAYNRGPGPVDMSLMRGKDPKNTYAPKVLKVYERLKNLSIPMGA